MSARTEKRFRSVGLTNGFRFGYYPNSQVILEDLGVTQDPQKADEKLTEIVNRQLSAHSTATQSRDQFTTDIERVTGFKFLMEEKAGTGKNASKTRTVPAENEGEYVNRFRQACLDGNITFTPASDLGNKVATGTEECDGEVDIADQLIALSQTVPTTIEDVESWLQQLADLRVYNLDAKVTERTAKPKGPPKYALEGAEAIWGFGEQGWLKWTKRFNRESGTVLPPRPANEEEGKKLLITAIVANEAAMQSKYTKE